MTCDEFIAWYFAMMDACGWSNADGSPIEGPQTHVLDAFDKWRTGGGKPLMGDDGFPRDLGKYNVSLQMAWLTFPWDFKRGEKREVDRPAAFDNLAVRGIVPFFSSRAKHIPRRWADNDRIPPAEERRSLSADAWKYQLGFPLPYAVFTPDHHPTSPMHIALWNTSFYEWWDKWGEGFRYLGPYVSRADELEKLHYSFIVEYIDRMEAQGWKNPDGSRIADALKHILDANDEWRAGQLAKPPEERVRAFGSDGFPIDVGMYRAFIHVAWDFFESYYTDNGFVDFGTGERGFDALTFRGLIPDTAGLRKLTLKKILEAPWLYAGEIGFRQ